MSTDILIIANPASGGGRGGSTARQAEQIIEQAGKTVRIAFTKAQGDAVRMAQEGVKQGVRRIVACGGDGTIHEVAGVLAGTETFLGLLPCGRGNDFARALDVPLKPDRAAELIIRGGVRRLDLGVVNGRHFCTVVTMGFDSEVARLVYEKAVPFTGILAYIISVIKMLRIYTGIPATLTGDFGRMEASVLLAATGNTRSYGGGMKIVPDASPEDGLLDVCHVRMMSRLRVLRMFPSVFWGGHVNNPSVHISRTSTLRIETPAPVWLFADGEPVCQTPADISVAEKALNVICVNE